MNYYIAVLKKYAVCGGRAQRAEYWYFTLCNVIISVGLLIIGIIGKNSVVGSTALSLRWLYSLAVLLPGFAVTIRRLHDTNRRGSWFFIGLIPLVGTIILIIFLSQDSQPGENKYGPNPKGITAA